MFTEIFGKEQIEKDTCWHSELKCLGVKPKAKKELGDNERLGELTESLKQTLHQQYKASCSASDKKEFLKSQKTFVNNCNREGSNFQGG